MAATLAADPPAVRRLRQDVFVKAAVAIPAVLDDLHQANKLGALPEPDDYDEVSMLLHDMKEIPSRAEMPAFVFGAVVTNAAIDLGNRRGIAFRKGKHGVARSLRILPRWKRAIKKEFEQLRLALGLPARD